MPDYLSKEEIRKWRSSLERITLEEYAARLGKVIQEEKHDDSLVDSVILKSLNSMTTEKYTPGTEKIRTLSIKSFGKEKEISQKTEIHPDKIYLAKKPEVHNAKKVTEIKPAEVVSEKEVQKTKEVKEEIKKIKPVSSQPKNNKEVKEEIKNEVKVPEKQPAKKVEEIKTSVACETQVAYSFKKPLTAREQTVFDHFLENRNTIVYAADLAKILNLPRDYVYKYIKNLRAKLNEDILQNAENGGYILKV